MLICTMAILGKKLCILEFFKLVLFRNQIESAAIIPLHQDVPDVIHISYCPFRSGRRCLNIIHAYKPDPRSCLELLFKPLNFISVVYHLVRQFVMTAFYYSVSTSIDGFHPSLLTNNPLPGKERGV